MNAKEAGVLQRLEGAQRRAVNAPYKRVLVRSGLWYMGDVFGRVYQAEYIEERREWFVGLVGEGADDTLGSLRDLAQYVQDSTACHGQVAEQVAARELQRLVRRAGSDAEVQVVARDGELEVTRRCGGLVTRGVVRLDAQMVHLLVNTTACDLVAEDIAVLLGWEV